MTNCHIVKGKKRLKVIMFSYKKEKKQKDMFLIANY